MNNNRLKLEFRDGTWDTVKKIAYKDVGSSNTFYKVDRQNIISSADGVGFNVRYFECGAHGFTTLEKHEHVHIVMIARGEGRVIIGNVVFEARPNDYFVIPSWAPHQLINAGAEPFAFFCSVNAVRDKFVLLTGDEIDALKQNEGIQTWIKIPDGYFNSDTQ